MIVGSILALVAFLQCASSEVVVPNGNDVMAPVQECTSELCNVADSLHEFVDSGIALPSVTEMMDSSAESFMLEEAAEKVGFHVFYDDNGFPSVPIAEIMEGKTIAEESEQWGFHPAENFINEYLGVNLVIPSNCVNDVGMSIVIQKGGFESGVAACAELGLVPAKLNNSNFIAASQLLLSCGGPRKSVFIGSWNDNVFAEGCLGLTSGNTFSGYAAITPVNCLSNMPMLCMGERQAV